jgi:tetratricopeptide (TPR) repeat protein
LSLSRQPLYPFEYGGKMKEFYKIIMLALFIVSVSVFPGICQTIPEEARRHMVRGQAALEMAKSPIEYDSAIKEFNEAARLAPGWPDPYYNLALLQEKTGKLREAVASLKQYLRLAPNAPDAAKIRDHIYRLEYKAEQVLSVPEIIDVLVSFLNFELDCDKNKYKAYGRLFWGELFLKREGNDAVKALSAILYYPERQFYQTLKVTGPILQYQSTINVCDQAANRAEGGCDSTVEYKIEVVSKTLVRVDMKVLRGGSGAGVATGQTVSCTYKKK